MLRYLDGGFVEFLPRAHIKHPFLFSRVLMTHPYGLRLVDQLLLHTAKQRKRNVLIKSYKHDAQLSFTYIRIQLTSD